MLSSLQDTNNRGNFISLQQLISLKLMVLACKNSFRGSESHERIVRQFKLSKKQQLGFFGWIEKFAVGLFFVQGNNKTPTGDLKEQMYCEFGSFKHEKNNLN